ncbi:MAG: pseudouridine synthase, partial [Hyphomicrobiales bacterium]
MAEDNAVDGGDHALPEGAPSGEAAGRGRRVGRDRSGRPDASDPDRPPADATPEAPSEAGERISKVVSRAGIASRRDVERMIEEGRIALNGATVTTPVTLVKPRDRISVDGVALPAKERTRLFLYHKPAGLMTTEKDPEDRPTVFSALPAGLPRLVSIGRLDLNTEGLLLLTNDGGLARVLAHPTTGWLRRYRVRAFGEITQDQLDLLKDGIEIEGMHYGPVDAHVDREQGSNMWLTLGLREGKNREVKRILEHFGLKVNRLIRISFGPFQLGDLEEGAVEEVRTRLLKDQLGPELARQAEIEFEDEAPPPQKAPRPPRRERPSGEPGRRRAEGAPFERRPDDRESKGAGPTPGDAKVSVTPDEARALRKAEAVAQGRRGAAHRHSWRDAESWAMRGERKGGAPKRQSRPSRGDKVRPPVTDDRQHLRGGRIADRKGHSVLVERILQDPAASAASPGKAGGPHASRPERQPEKRAPRGESDVLRRKTPREQGIAPRPRGGDGRERGPRPERFERSEGPRRSAGVGAIEAPRRPWRTPTDRGAAGAAPPYRRPSVGAIARPPGGDRPAREERPFRPARRHEQGADRTGEKRDAPRRFGDRKFGERPPGRAGAGPSPSREG